MGDPSAEQKAIRLVKDAFFLREMGERPPGAPYADSTAETWGRWDREAETFLRSLEAAGSEGETPA